MDAPPTPSSDADSPSGAAPDPAPSSGTASSPGTAPARDASAGADPAAAASAGTGRSSAPVPAPPAPAPAPATIAVTAGRPEHRPGAPVNPSITLSSTYVASTYVASACVASDAAAAEPLDGPAAPGTVPVYGRWANRTWEAFETALGHLEGGQALLFGSGMAAIAAALSPLPAGATVVVPRHAYSGTLGLLKALQDTGRLAIREVDLADTESTVAALPGAALLWVETPTNPMLEVADLPALVTAAHQLGTLVVVDNTFATPLGQRPIEHGADLVVHSVTKYLAGHSDIVLGAAVTADAALGEQLTTYRTLHGAIPGPFEAWLALRGLRTLAVRMDRAGANAAELARRLQGHPGVERVRHPGLPDDPGHQRAARLMHGFGAIIAIEVRGGAAAAEQVAAATRLWVHATSLGGVESTLERRRRHAAEAVTVPENLLRLSVGIEDVEDLWADLDQALRSLRP